MIVDYYMNILNDYGFAQSHYLEYIFMGMAISGNLIDGMDGIVLIAMIVDYIYERIE